MGVTVMLTLGAGLLSAQFGKRLGEAIQRRAEDVVIRKAENATEKTVDAATDPDSYKSDGNNGDENTDGSQAESDNQQPTSGSGNQQLVSNQQLASNQQSGAGGGNQQIAANNERASAQTNSGQSSAPAKLESYTQYDFVPGDQILFFEDFSQDDVGDFPDKWTTNKSGEVRTINIAPGKWYHPTETNAVTAYLKALKFPENFILEFDFIHHADEESDDIYKGYNLTIYNGDKELDDSLYPGDGGLRLEFYYNTWQAIGYTPGAVDSYKGASEKNTIGDGVNHVIMWVQKRRVRVYHQGAKVLDLPTVIPAETIFNRLCFQGWSDVTLPFISNIKITTAAPDVRSKLITEGKLISYGINFDSGKDVIKPESYGAVKSIADVLKENAGVRVRVVGHTDADGSAETNLDLSKRRATAVKNYLVKEFGIEGGRIETDGKGQTEPLAPNNTVEGKAKNRRVEFVKIN
jgi:flagellar motor protein MotB